MKRNILLFLVALAVFGCATKKDSIPVEDLKEMLKEHALIVAQQDGTVETYDDNGIKPLFKHLEKGTFKDCYVFDKVTGKASALVLVYGEATVLYTTILSKEAIPVLEKHGIQYYTDKTVDYIVNMTGDDKCPMEKTVTDIDDPAEAFQVLKEKFGK